MEESPPIYLYVQCFHQFCFLMYTVHNLTNKTDILERYKAFSARSTKKKSINNKTSLIKYNNKINIFSIQRKRRLYQHLAEYRILFDRHVYIEKYFAHLLRQITKRKLVHHLRQRQKFRKNIHQYNSPSRLLTYSFLCTDAHRKG